MNESTRFPAPSLLRLIVELRGTDLPSNNVYLEIVSELDSDTLSATLAQLEKEGLIAWSERGEQWTPTMRGLLIGIGLPAYEPGECLLDMTSSTAECA
jgi:hypothetical protein